MAGEIEITQGTMSPQVKEKARKFLLWIGLVSIAMMFAGLTSGYIVRRADGYLAKV